MYRLLNPKYIELYSRNPPNIAPIKLADKAAGTSVCFTNSLEKANPEKNKGIVNKITENNFTAISGRPAKLSVENTIPNTKDKAKRL